MRIVAAAVVLCVFMAGCASAPRQSSRLIDDEYVLALSAADEFLGAWRMRDQDRGLAILSPRLLRSKGEARWRQAISGVSNPHHESYEVTNGRRLPDGRYSFDVYVYWYYTGEPERRRREGKPAEHWEKGPPQKILLLKTGLDEWKVDEVPEI
jgi:hypothetical protein